MEAVAHQKLSVEEYVALEDAATERHEFYDGEIYAMSGGSPRHHDLVANLMARLLPELKKHGCRGRSSEQRVQVLAGRYYTYPDLTVVCGDAKYSERDPQSLLNPVVLFEVLSPSTERYDRTFKLDQYRRIPSVNMVVLIAQERRRVETYTPTENGWLLQVFTDPEEILQLPIEGVSTTLAEIYDGVELDSEDPRPPSNVPIP